MFKATPEFEEIHTFLTVSKGFICRYDCARLDDPGLKRHEQVMSDFYLYSKQFCSLRIKICHAKRQDIIAIKNKDLESLNIMTIDEFYLIMKHFLY